MPEFDNLSQRQMVDFMCPILAVNPFEIRDAFTQNTDPWLVQSADLYLQGLLVSNDMVDPATGQAPEGLAPNSPGQQIVNDWINNNYAINPVEDPSATVATRLHDLFNGARTAGRGEASVQDVAISVREYQSNNPASELRRSVEQWMGNDYPNFQPVPNRTFVNWEWNALLSIANGTTRWP